MKYNDKKENNEIVNDDFFSTFNYSLLKVSEWTSKIETLCP